MVVLNIHIAPRVQSWRALWSVLAAYRLPLLIFISATFLVWGYNVFFFRLLRAVREANTTEVLLLEAARTVEESRYVLHHTATGTFAACALIVGNFLLALMYWSFLRVIFTCAGYVPANPWRCAPRADAERQRHLQLTWQAKQKWIREEGVAARQRAAQALQAQQAWWAHQMCVLQQQALSMWLPSNPELVTSLGSPPPSAATLGWLPASTEASSDGSFVMTAPKPPQTFSPRSLVAAGSRAALGTQALAAAAASVSVNMASAAALPANAGVPCSGSAGPQRECSSFSKPHSSTPSSSEETTTTTVATVSSSCSSLSSSASGSTTPAVITPDLELTSVSGLHRSPTNGDAEPAASSLHHRLRTPVPAAESTVNPHLVLDYEADGSLRFCCVCDQYKPDGSHHCRACQRCVFDMDHHCHFLNNCIGRHNYKYFFLCCFYSTACCAVNTTLFVTAYVCSAMCQDWGHSWWWVPAGMCVIGLRVADLWVQHVFLLIRGVSTLDRMAELSAELFLASVSGPRRSPAATPGSCYSDCEMVIEECYCGVVALMKCLADRVRCSRYSRRPHDTITSSLTSGSWGDGEVDAPLALSSRAKRRAQRTALLFGRPRLFLYHLLPLSPLAESLRPRARHCEGEV
nr:unnamed protein product [Leishmania braziliensis]